MERTKTQKSNHALLSLLVVTIALVSSGPLLLFTGCASNPPIVALAAADNAVANANLAAKCAPDEYRSANQMLEKAHALSREGKHKEAEIMAEGAKELAERALKLALDNKEECLERLAAKQQPRAPQPDGGLKQVHLTGPDGATEGLTTIHFEYNEWSPNTQARQVLNMNASWLKRNDSVHIFVAGHCDDRGSTEYNLALGERRAKSTRDFLINLGIDPQRLTVISYGKEAPLDASGTEQGHYVNRRVEFITR